MKGIGAFNEVNVFRPAKKYLLRIALLYPSTYEASITNLFTHIAYYYLAHEPGILIDRFTLDNPHFGALTGYGLKDFDVILASISYELDLINLIKMLLNNGINPQAKKRRKPFIIIGGIPPTANPMPYSAIGDAVFVGEGELVLELLKELVNEIKITNLDNKETLLSMLYDRSRSIYSDVLESWGIIDKLTKFYVKDLNKSFHPTLQIRSLLKSPVYGEGYYVEASRGCKWLCPFCLESYVTYPFRFRSLTKILELIDDGLKHAKERRVIFLSLSFFDHPDSTKILTSLLENGIKFSVPSLRYDTLDEFKVDLILKGGQKTITIAPETVEEIPSCAIRKCFKGEEITQLVRYILSKGANVKLYFMVGIPGESDDVGRKIAKFINDILNKSRIVRRKQVRLTVNPLIPKPNTPMQYLGMISKKEFRKKVKELISGIESKSIVRINVYEWNYAYVQAAIGLGDKNLGNILINAAQEGIGISKLRLMLKHYERRVLMDKDTSEPFPWNIVELGLSALVRHLGKALLNIKSS